ncbi:glycoside hydrolase family 47 protein [Xylariaceae sp. FL0594]|nr:glycoside hydrolase family 47 protein [Xylariaceae sp. FL0594]
MFRLRRYRYYVFFAAILVFLLYRVVENSDQWEAVSSSFPKAVTPSKPNPPPVGNSHGSNNVGGSSAGLAAEEPDLPQRILDNTGKSNTAATIPDLKPPNHGLTDHPHDPDAAREGTKEVDVVAYDHDQASKSTTATVIDLPDRKTGQSATDLEGNESKLQADEPIHWKKVPEHFPVPKDDIIRLPAGKPKKIPTIQYAFEKESSEIREIREARQALVKAEMERGWAGYWKYARGHDELRPVTKTFRDPFCGWAATLVDSLDTLWIMGMEDEFKKAMTEVEKIDFTISKRSEIPVFETTIRYLGGLIAAYDVSGGKSGGYDILLIKAIELAEILMGVFDTPNRMPVLYYDWKPQSASRPKRATSASVAELGSLAMEFTRLAQLTKENKYYDAVARITDAFYEWQQRGTSIPGIFPEQIDVSGCNRTAQYELEAAQNAAESAAVGGASAREDGDGVLDSTSADSRAGTVYDPEGDLKTMVMHDEFGNGVSRVARRAGQSPSVNLVKKKNPKTGKVELVAGEQTLPDCVSQGLTAGGYGLDAYSMGGSQDSTYEYFPKQWLLLGGLEPKYKELHLRTTEAVKKWLLYRPMIPDNRNILFSGKVVTHGDPENDATTQYEVTHLTCFLGGMFGMGGKMFEIPADVEIGKQLTDGCVWAYESTATGIMPEGAHVLPCPNPKNCHWNQTMYEQALDPLYDSRDEQLQEYYDRKAKAKAAAKAAKAKEKEQKRLQKEKEAKQLEQQKKEKKLEKDAASSTGNEELSDSTNSGSENSKMADMKPVLQKRAPVSSPGKSSETEITEKKTPQGTKKTDLSSSAHDDDDSDPAPRFEKPAKSQVPLQVQETAEEEEEEEEEETDAEDPFRPLTHKEFIANKVVTEGIPQGFVDVMSKSYILRPEAIESVWYMYRITGDRKWQEKGWDMFEAIVRHTTTDVGNSAIGNVLTTNTTQSNEMESFWTAETLKYFYLLYSDPNVISLDQWVLNTEAHPFKRPKTSFAV